MRVRIPKGRTKWLVYLVLPIFVLSLLLGIYFTNALGNYFGPPQSSENLTQFVNPFIGTQAQAGAPFGGGDTFPGAAYPFGMVQFSPDTISNPPGGYSYTDAVIKDFSLTHFSGRGCQVYQDFPFMPYVGSVVDSPAASPSTYYSNFSHANETARPGFYQVYLDSVRVAVELSVTPHTGIAQFGFPPSNDSTILINAGGSVNGNANSSIMVYPSDNEVDGSAESTVGCGTANYRLYFAAKFDAPFLGYGTWNGAKVNHDSNLSVGQHTGAFISFDTSTNRMVTVQGGISFVSVANAKLNLAHEFASYDIDGVAKIADQAWNERLNSIRIGPAPYGALVNFYTALYHVFIQPNIFDDVNGQYLGFDGQVHTVPSGHAQYENIAGWDQYRSQISLLAILNSSVASDIAQSLVNDAQQGDGHLPRWEQANVDSHGMTGDSADVLIADAYAFGASDFDTHGALSAMINGQPQVREGLVQYETLGYVPDNFSYSASITLEYSNDDFAIAQFANSLGDPLDYRAFLSRSSNWQNLFNASSGFVEPRSANGLWAPNFNPASESGFQEGDSSQYTWLVPFNLPSLFDSMGGDSVAVGRLDSFFSELNGGTSSNYAFMGNEPTFEVPWEYDYALAPSHTQDVVRRIEIDLFQNSPGGLPGNDDGGAMSSWYVFATLGLYPEIPSVGGFVVGSPLFPSVTVKLSNGNTLRINAAGASDSTPYVSTLSVNGGLTQKLWIPWSIVSNGSTIDFTLVSASTVWGSTIQDSPPSYS